MQRLRLFAMCMLAATASTASVWAQFGDPKEFVHDEYVVQIGARTVSPAVAEIIAGQLRPRLADWSEEEVPNTWVQLNDNGQKLDDAPLFQLVVRAQSSEIVPGDEELRRLWNIAREQLETELRRVTAMTGQAQLNRLIQQLDVHQIERQRLEIEADRLTKHLALQQAETAGNDRENLAKAIAEAVSNQRELQIEDAGIQAKREAIEKRIDELRERAAAEGDPIVSELAKVVKIREEAHEILEAVSSTQQSVTKSQLLESEDQVAQAKIELLRAQREAEDRVSGGALRELNNELSRLVVEAARIEGQRKKLGEIVEQLRSSVRDTARSSAAMASVESELQDVQQRLASNRFTAGNLRTQMESPQGPEISLRPLVAGDATQEGEPEASAPGASAAKNVAPDQP